MLSKLLELRKCILCIIRAWLLFCSIRIIQVCISYLFSSKSSFLSFCVLYFLSVLFWTWCHFKDLYIYLINFYVNKSSVILFSLYGGGSRPVATSKMKLFVIIVNGFQPLSIITKCSILDVAAVLDPPLLYISYL